MDPNHHLIQYPQAPEHITIPSAPPSSSRKRKKQEGNPEEGSVPAEPRRLRRSHEACARCRSKKIRCDSKYPKCTACATAGADCQQENRLKQTLQPRGHTEQLERQLALAGALLKRFVPDFDWGHLDEICLREGIDVNTILASLHSAESPTKLFSYPPPGLVSPAYPVHLPYPPHPPGTTYPPIIPPGAYPVPVYQHPAPFPLPSSAGPAPTTPRTPIAQPKSAEIAGQDPQSNDMSNAEALAKNFGVNASIFKGLPIASSGADKEDLAVGSNGLDSGRDRQLAELTIPRDKSHWISATVRTGNVVDSHIEHGSTPSAAAMSVWLPRDRDMVNHIVEVYFTRLNPHRPVYPHTIFTNTLNDLYTGQLERHDPGFLCSLYLVLALGTLSELSHRATDMDQDGATEQMLPKNLMPQDWPDHQEFFECALLVKPDLRVTISSVQALILLHWYLYTERQGRTLWRLVGSILRLAIELGLHHDPTRQKKLTGSEVSPVFSSEQCQLRINLWAIIMIHDRGTSILLGRPLGISPADSNIPHPRREQQTEFSEHFEFSAPVADIQADIINSLYRQKSQTSKEITGHAKRIIKSMVEFRETLPESYRFYFGGTEDWPLERRSKLVEGITENQGLTLLKLGIARILLLRALFNCKQLSYNDRHKALVDAIVASHNIIVVHNQLIQYPDIAFFTSPIPLHIAAMVILYGHMSKCDRLSKQVALEDMWLALDMLPRFRWRWERKDQAGGHPLIAKLAARVMEVDLHTIQPPKHAFLLSEEVWDSDEEDNAPSTATMRSPALTPTSAYPSSVSTQASSSIPAYGPQPSSQAAVTSNGSVAAGGYASTSRDQQQQLADINEGFFYPFYPEEPGGQFSVPPTPTGRHHPHQYANLLAAASPHVSGYGMQPSQDQYVFGDRDGRYTQRNQDMPPHPMQWPNRTR